jgi:hypothetical protein
MGLTKKRDLRTRSVVWTAYRHARIPMERLTRATRADVVVVGARITGALVSQALTEIGIRPLILERRDGARLGSTAASTALLQFELDTPLLKLSRPIGPRAAERVWRRSHAAVNDLRTLVHRLGIEAHLKSRPSPYLAGNVLNASGLRHEVRARQRLGLPSELLDRRELRRHFDIERSAAILSHGNAEADPIALTIGFLKHSIHGGARLHGPHEVTGLHASRAGITVFTHAGPEIYARYVILCTVYEFPKIVPLEGNRISSTWALATRVNQGICGHNAHLSGRLRRLTCICAQPSTAASCAGERRRSLPKCGGAMRELTPRPLAWSRNLAGSSHASMLGRLTRGLLVSAPARRVFQPSARFLAPPRIPPGLIGSLGPA